MTYELAKKLKDAGYILERYVYNGRPKDERWFVEGEYEYRIPTLSELIAACGDGFSCLIKQADCWCCNYCSDFDPYNPTPNFPTSEEAVADLWLKLHEKK